MSWRFPWEPPALLRTVIVNLKSETAIKGVLWGKRGQWLILRDAYALTVGHEPTKVDGECLVLMENIDFVQVLP